MHGTYCMLNLSPAQSWTGIPYPLSPVRRRLTSCLSTSYMRMLWALLGCIVMKLIDHAQNLLHVELVWYAPRTELNRYSVPIISSTAPTNFMSFHQLYAYAISTIRFHCDEVNRSCTELIACWTCLICPPHRAEQVFRTRYLQYGAD